MATNDSITLTAPEFAGTTQYTVYRKLRSDADFPGSPMATISSPTDLKYKDTSISPNVLYEYKVVRTASAGVGYGYICTGFEVPASAWADNADHYMGKVLVLTENGLSASIGTELAQLATDLKADGWVPLMDNSVSSTDNPDDVRDLIIDAHTADPLLKAVLLIGRIPIPLTQNNTLYPDAHSNMPNRLWPCDGYYGDMDGSWSKHGPKHEHAGHFNMHSFPLGGVELAVGRVDLSDMSAFSSTEAQLTSDYLQRAHDFRMADLVPLDRGVILDNLEWTTYPNAGGAWKSMAPLVGNAVTEPTSPLPADGIYRAFISYGDLSLVHHVDLNETTWYAQSVLTNEGSYLWTFGGGAGDNDQLGQGAQRVGHTDTTALSGYEFGGAFNMTYGSYMGRWQLANNYLRAVLATGHALTSVWSGSPNWYFHNMGMGEPVGRSALQSMNNTSTRYTPQDSWGAGDAPNIQMSLLGDPTIRMRMVAPPTNLEVSNENGEAHFEWTASAGVGVAGYYLYVFDEDGVPSLVDPDLIVGTSFSTLNPFDGESEFMVRAAKLETTASGSYWNLSLGTFGTMPPSEVEVKVLLGGPYDPGSGLMNDALRTLTAFPPTEPYTALNAGMDPVGGGGDETTNSGVLAVSGSNAIVDWVLVELRSIVDPSEVVEARCGLVQRDGDVVAADDGTSPLQFSSYGDFHIAVRHRNHLGAMTTDTIALSSVSSAAADLTDPATDTYGTDAQKNVSGTMVLWPGNVHASDHTVKYTGTNNDRDPILSAVGGSTPTNTIPDVYAMEDVNMDDTIKYAGADNDRDIILVTIGGVEPTNTRAEQLP